MIHLAGKMIHHIFSMGLDKTAFTTKEWLDDLLSALIYSDNNKTNL